MNRILSVAALLLVGNALPVKAGVGDTIASKTAEINGAKLHYLTAGNGTALILLHGYAETSLMWRPLIPALAERFTVIGRTCRGLATRIFPRMAWT
jgi:hypothetical protein